MDKHEAKLILSSYTLENKPDSDPRFNKAAELAANDPELTDWWNEQQAGDALIKEQLAQTICAQRSTKACTASENATWGSPACAII